MENIESAMLAAKPLTSQVGGHAGVLAMDDGSLIIKPVLPLELEFYQRLRQNPGLASLRPFTPQFIGTLRLEGKIDESKYEEADGITVVPIDIPEKDQCILILENLSHSFLKPNILDVKLGTVLYDESAPPEKVQRMLKAARETTSLETGVRLTGFQVYDNITGEVIITPKAYGKSIKASDLPHGIEQFFPVGASSEDQKSTHGLLHSTLLPILRAIREDVAEIREVYSSHEIRMIGGSLLIVYEADWTRAEEGVKRLGISSKSDDEDKEGEEEGEEEGEGEEEAEDSDEEDEGDDIQHPGPPHVVRLIDFAHTRLTPGRGPDEGVLLGLDTLLRLLDGRIAQLG